MSTQRVQYTSMDDAVFHEIVEPIEHGDVEDAYEEFDIEAIAREAIEGVGEGVNYKLQLREDLDHDEFWDIVAKHARPQPDMPNEALANLLGAPDASDALTETVASSDDDASYTPALRELDNEDSL